MKILYDHQTFIEQEFGGISRYYYELITRMISRNISVDHSILYSNNEYLKSDKLFRINPYIGLKNFLTKDYFFGKNKLFHLAKKIGLIDNQNLEMESLIQKKIFFDAVDIFHPTYYNTYYLDWIHKTDTKVVLTVYDLIHEKFFQYFPGSEKFLENKRQCIEAATKVIAISENTKRDLIQIYKIPEEKVRVIHLASSLFSKDEQVLPNSDFSNSILFVGNRSIYKNFRLFLESILPLLFEFPEMRIILAGGEEISKRERDFFIKNHISDRIIRIPFKNNFELMSLYRSCRLFVFPSLYEGFGIPIIEAMQNRCPVVCSNTSSLVEVSGDAAHFFDPQDSESIYRSVREVYSNSDLRMDLIKRGLVQSERFSWEKTLDDTYNLYKEMYKK